MLVRLGLVARPELGHPGVSEDQQRHHVPCGEPELREHGRILWDLTGRGGDTHEVAPGAAVTDLDQVQDDAKPLRARTGEAGHARVAAATNSPRPDGEP